MHAMIPRWNWSDGFVLASLILAIIGLGVYPIPFIDVIEQAAEVLPIGTD